MAEKIKIPSTDSIHELASFWDLHDITDFDEELEEVTESVFTEGTFGTSVSVKLEDEEVKILKKIARNMGKKETDLISEWIHHKIHEFI
ncbi:hypothetical protein JW948_09085 [bacterium]|nr:hypothetical protein [bacterium]